MGLHERLELVQLGAADDAVQVHLLQDGVGGQLLAALVLEQGCQHSGALLSCIYQSIYILFRFFTHNFTTLNAI